MNITANESRNVLGHFNVAEAARRLEISERKMRWEIAPGRLPSPTVTLGKRQSAKLFRDITTAVVAVDDRLGR